MVLQQLMVRGWSGSSLSGAGSGSAPEAPPGFIFANQKTYAESLIRGISVVDTDWATTNLDAPVAAASVAVRVAIEGALGKPMSQLVDLAGTGNLSAIDVSDATGAISSLLKGSLKVVSEFSEAAKTIGDIAGSFPILGQIVSVVVNLVVGLLGADSAHKAAEEAAERKLHNELGVICKNAWQLDQPFGTGYGGAVTPSDLFRKMAFGNPSRMVFNTSSMLLMLCGSEGGAMSKERSRELRDRGRESNSKIGIPPATQRRMFKLIKGIMTTVVNPISDHPIGDQGFTLMPILVGIVRKEYLRGTWDKRFAKILSDEIAGTLRHEASVPHGATQITRYGTCRGGHGYGRHIDLSKGLVELASAFGTDLSYQFWDAGKQKWSLTARDAPPVEQRVFTGKLHLTKDLAESADRDLDRIGRGRSGAFLDRNATKAIIAGLSAIGAYAAVQKYL